MDYIKKHKKVFIIICSAILLFIGIYAFANRKPARPASTNLEFWIGENVDEVDFSGYTEKFGLFGGRAFYGTGYVPSLEGDRQIDPDRCVVYTVTAFPDYSGNKRHVTHIFITDPEVSFYGISLNSSHKEFERLITEQGFRITETNANYHTAKRGKYTVIFTKECIHINVEVRNFWGIQF